MKKILAIFLLLASIGTLTLFHIPQISELRSYPSETLEQEMRNLQIQSDAASLSGSSTSTSKKNELRMKIMSYRIELARRSYGLEWIMGIAGLLGLTMLFSKFLKKKNVEQTLRKVRVNELLPSEIYVDESEFYQRKHDGFTSKESALAWFENDPLKVCNYCGSHNVKPIRGQQDNIQLMTFYKKVPAGAKDMRIILGSFWYVKAAAELQCENCGQKVFR